ncbi:MULTISPECIES: ROK family transcriptional regulator [unclassified Streptomyces]|uniref:ROK family transcriptional regulator n=1 Tax=unclassified Streptomyces TaxID=2593676 RepID=UPI00036D33B3|nr:MULTISPECIES: ROK family transcriptional regulator [unclassified Streptomyces]MYX35343.1 ROK family protein [Streptomyces sp. SID8377]
MRAVADHGEVSRAAVAAEVGLTRATVSTLVDELLATGLLVELGTQRPGTVGRPGTALALNDSGPAGLGAEVGVDHLAAVAVDLRGTVRARARVEADNRGRPAQEVLRELAVLVAEVRQEARAAGLGPAGLTLAVPGLVGRDRQVVMRAPNLGWEDVDAAGWFERSGGGGLATSPVPVTVENEANLGALAELWLGGHEGVTDFVHVSAEIGIGAALVVDGRLFRGARGFAGELGHVPVHPTGPRCSCGARGCLEQYAGEEAVLRAAGIAPERPDALKALQAAASQGDPAALKALAAAGAAFGIALSGAVNLLDPQAVVLGGTLASLAPWLRSAVERELGRRVTDRQWRADAVRVSRLGREGVLLGAAYSVVRAVLDDPQALRSR